jgi:broad specificity phosphatase PhoE
MSRIYLVRHGQASLERSGAGGLTPTGVRQCEALAGHWRAIGRRMDLVFAGTLPRQLESAQAFVRAAAGEADAAATVRRLPGIEEYDHLALIAAHAGPAGIPGDARDLHGRLVPALEDWVENRLDGVERFADFRARCSAPPVHWRRRCNPSSASATATCCGSSSLSTTRASAACCRTARGSRSNP